MFRGQHFDATDGVHNQLRHGRVVVVPTWMVALTNGTRQLRVRHSMPVKLTIEDDQNRIAATVDVLLSVRPVRNFDESPPEPMRLQIELDIGAATQTTSSHKILAL
jgi:hypothetical protein